MTIDMTTDEIILSVSQVEHVFTPPSGKKLEVLKDIHFQLHSGELLALLGPSGCGKSTLVRIVAGLLRPTKGEVTYRGELLTGPNPKAALVFQQFALYPWLTVSQNIEQALIPRGIDEKVRKEKIAEVISLIGLDGFEEAYPRELSGGMKQRVGMARALAVNPELLCMDEPFSQVDALTAETLRNEVINLWRDRERYPQSILMVSHDISEVVLMANRILVMAANPGHVKIVFENPLPYPRDPRSPAYQALVNKLHDIITGLYLPEEEGTAALPSAVSAPEAYQGIQTIAPVPLVEIRDLIGLLESVEQRGGSVEIFRLTDEMGTTFTRILLASKASDLLGFMITPQDDLVLTDKGKEFVAATRKVRRHVLRAQLMRLPLIRRLSDMIEKGVEHRLSRDILLDELAIQCPQEDPKRLLRILINWARFAEVWKYNPADQTIGLINGNREK